MQANCAYIIPAHVTQVSHCILSELEAHVDIGGRDEVVDVWDSQLNGLPKRILTQETSAHEVQNQVKELLGGMWDAEDYMCEWNVAEAVAVPDLELKDGFFDKGAYYSRCSGYTRFIQLPDRDPFVPPDLEYFADSSLTVDECQDKCVNPVPIPANIRPECNILLLRHPFRGAINKIIN